MRCFLHPPNFKLVRRWSTSTLLVYRLISQINILNLVMVFFLFLDILNFHACVFFYVTLMIRLFDRGILFFRRVTMTRWQYAWNPSVQGSIDNLSMSHTPSSQVNHISFHLLPFNATYVILLKCWNVEKCLHVWKWCPTFEISVSQSNYYIFVQFHGSWGKMPKISKR